MQVAKERKRAQKSASAQKLQTTRFETTRFGTSQVPGIFPEYAWLWYANFSSLLLVGTLLPSQQKKAGAELGGGVVDGGAAPWPKEQWPQARSSAGGPLPLHIDALPSTQPYPLLGPASVKQSDSCALRGLHLCPFLPSGPCETC